MKLFWRFRGNGWFSNKKFRGNGWFSNKILITKTQEGAENWTKSNTIYKNGKVIKTIIWKDQHPMDKTHSLVPYKLAKARIHSFYKYLLSTYHSQAYGLIPFVLNNLGWQ